MWNKASLGNEIMPLPRRLYKDIHNRVSMLYYATVNKSKSATFSLAASHKIVISWHDCNEIRPIILLVFN